MRLTGLIFLGILLAGIGCHLPESRRVLVNKPKIDTPSLKSLSDDSLNPIEKSLKSVPANIAPVIGYRFVITGDFDGDGRKDTLVEHFTSLLTNKETNKFYDGLTDYGQLVALTVKKEPHSFVSCTNRKIDSLEISMGGQLLGLSYLKNEGDLDGDGADEVSYVVDWADWSNLNTCHLVSYKHHKWIELYSFSMWDWQLPSLPQFPKSYGFIGIDGLANVMKDDSLNNSLEKGIRDFSGLIRKIKNNRIEVYRDERSFLDTALIDLQTKKVLKTQVPAEYEDEK